MADETQIPGEPDAQDESGLTADGDRKAQEDEQLPASGNGAESTFAEHAPKLSVE